MISQDLLDILVCPLCKGPVLFSPDEDAVVCRKCLLAYPVKEDIPVMLQEESTSIPAEWLQDKDRE